MSGRVQLAGVWHTARRAGLKRSLYRAERILRTRVINPRMAHLLYRVDAPHAPDVSLETIGLLHELCALRPPSKSDESIPLLNQAPVKLAVPLNWIDSPIKDPLWLFELHQWDWAWSRIDDNLPPLILDWIEQNPVGQGIGWEAYPLSRRLIVWCAAWFLLELESDTILQSMAEQAKYLIHNLERDLDHNHLLANGKALAWYEVLFRQEETLGRDILFTTLREQVGEDGGHLENSTGYHVGVWLDGLETALLCRSCGVSVPQDIWEILERMGDFALGLLRPDGRLPLLSDTVEDKPIPVKNLFKLAGDKLGRDDFLWATGADKPHPTQKKQHYIGTGYTVFRSGYATEDTYLLFDAGDFGLERCPGHGHADTLSIELWSNGEPLIIDPGTYQYPAGEWREYFRGTKSHSTITVDNQDQTEFVGAFRIGRMAKSTLLSTDKNYIIASHDGYRRLSDPVTHTRTVQYQSSKLISLTDTLTCAHSHTISLRFHLATTNVKISKENEEIEATFPHGTKLYISIKPTESSPTNGQINIEPAWTSRYWYEKSPSIIATYDITISQTETIKTSLRIQP